MDRRTSRSPVPSAPEGAAPAQGRLAVRLAMIGCNHRSAPLELRERVAFTAEQALEAADALRRRAVLEEAVVLSTCNRSEVYGVPGEATSDPIAALEQFFLSFHGISPGDWRENSYALSDSEAIRHLLRVAAGLDSMLLGESEILAQVRNAYTRALEHGGTGPVLNRAFQLAIEAGKRVRAETEVGARPMSVPLAGIKLAERVFGNLKGRAALILGAGAVAEQALDHLRARGSGALLISNRSLARAEALAKQTGGEAVAWDALDSALPNADLVLASAAVSEPFLTRPMLERALAARQARPLFVMDFGVPRNVAPDAAGLYNLYLYNIGDLQEIVEQNKRARAAEIPRAETIVAEQLAKFDAWRAGIELSSVADELRACFYHERKKLLDQLLREHPGASPAERQRLSRATEELVERILAEPARRLRRAGTMRGRLGAIEALRHLFGLDRNSP